MSEDTRSPLWSSLASFFFFLSGFSFTFSLFLGWKLEVTSKFDARMTKSGMFEQKVPQQSRRILESNPSQKKRKCQDKSVNQHYNQELKLLSRSDNIIKK